MSWPIFVQWHDKRPLKHEFVKKNKIDNSGNFQFLTPSGSTKLSSLALKKVSINN